MSNMVVATNVMALNSHRSLKGVGEKQSKAASRLSSGYRVNTAADDAAGLAISEKMRAQIRGLDMASKNSQDAISLIQTAEGGMQEIDNMIQRIRELVVQASNDTNENNRAGTGDRQKLQDEITQLVTEIDSMAERTEFNKKKVINGDFSDPRELVNLRRKQMDAATANLGDAVGASSKAQVRLNDANAAYTTFTGAGGVFGVMVSAANAFFGSSQTITATREYDEALSGFKDILLNMSNPTDVASFTTSDLLVGTAAQAFLEGTTYQVTLSVAGRALAFTGTSDAANAFKTSLDNFKSNLTAASTAITSVASAALGSAFSAALTAFTAAKPTAAGTGNAQLFNDYQTALYNLRWQEFQKAAPTTLDAAATALNNAKNLYLGKSAENEFIRLTADVLSGNAAVNSTGVEARTALDSSTRSSQLLTEAVKINSEGRPNSLYFQVGANSFQRLEMSIGSVKSNILGIGDGLGNTNIDVVKDSGRDTTSLLDTLDEALSYVTTERSKLGAAQNRLEFTIKSLDISSENLSASESRIRDADMAKEMMRFTQSNVLQQAATSMLAQANQAPQNVLSLLR